MGVKVTLWRNRLNFFCLSCEQSVYFVELLAHVQIQIDAIKCRSPFLFLVRHQLTIALHVGARLLVELANLFFVLALIELEGDIDVGRAGIELGLRQVGVEGDDLVAHLDTFAIAA